MAERDDDAYGYPFGTVGSRLDALARDLPTVRDRWAHVNPPPMRDVPVLIGGKGERKTLRIVAEHADVWHGFAGPEEVRRLLDVLQRHAEEVGRDVGTIEIGDELRQADDPSAQALHDEGVRLFRIGVTGPDLDWALIRRWLQWRDAMNS